MNKYINAPFNQKEIDTLKAGDYVYISGTIYTARDAAHKRMYEALEKGENLPFDIKGNVIYYMDLLRQGKEDQSGQQGLPQQAAWINMRQSLWT